MLFPIFLPGDELTVNLCHIGMQDGNIVVNIETSNAWGKPLSNTSGPDTETEDEGDINMDRMDLEEEDEEEDRWMDFDIHSTSVSVSASSSPEQPKLINYHHITTITTDIIWPVMVMPI